VSTYVQYAVDGMGLGCIYALMALSLALLFGVMGLMNFAFGELIMIGGFTVYYLRDEPALLILAVTIVVVVIASVVMEALAFRPVRHASPTTLLITSFALSIGLQYAVRATVGPIAKPVPPIAFLSDQFEIGNVRVQWLDVITAIATVLLVFGLTLILRKTMLGIHLRAATEDFSMASLVGVRGNVVIPAAFALTGILAGVCAFFYVAGSGSVSYQMGANPVLVAFVGVAVGGLGSLYGAAIGGFLLGASLTILQATLPVDWSTYTPALAYAGVIAIFLLRPQGLIARRTTRV
jgi:branched-chain amino acid transport system permease protein